MHPPDRGKSSFFPCPVAKALSPHSDSLSGQSPSSGPIPLPAPSLEGPDGTAASPPRIKEPARREPEADPLTRWKVPFLILLVAVGLAAHTVQAQPTLIFAGLPTPNLADGQGLLVYAGMVALLLAMAGLRWQRPRTPAPKPTASEHQRQLARLLAAAETRRPGATSPGLCPSPAAEPLEVRPVDPPTQSPAPEAKEAAEPGPPPLSLTTQPLAHLTILLVDDSPDIQRLVCRLLRQTGAHVAQAWDGQQALEALDRGRIDLILMDVEMPVMDGLAATAALRARGLTLPIVALSAHDQPEMRARLRNAGCTDHLTKPATRSALVATALRWCPTPASTEPGPDPLEPVPSPTSRPPAFEIVSNPAPESAGETLIGRSGQLETEAPLEAFPAGLRSQYALDPALEELVSYFVGVLPERLKALERALVTEDFTSLIQLAHQLKGAAGSFGFPSITGPAARLEAQARAGDAMGCERSLDQLRGLIEATQRCA